jgi:hypothetical protein
VSIQEEVIEAHIFASEVGLQATLDVHKLAFIGKSWTDGPA